MASSDVARCVFGWRAVTWPGGCLGGQVGVRVARWVCGWPGGCVGGQVGVWVASSDVASELKT